MVDMKERRKHYLVDAPVQLRLVGLVLAAGFCTLLIAGSFFWLNWQVLSILIESTSVEASVLNEVFLFYGGLCLLAVLSLLVVLSLVTLIVSNRVLGPIYRLRTDLDSMLENEEIQLFSVRDRDHIQDFVRQLNRFVIAVKRSDKTLEGAGDIPEDDEELPPVEDIDE